MSQLKSEKIKLLFVLALSAPCMSQVPQGVTASMYEPSAPELQAYVNWQPVTGATAYKVYKEVATSICPTAGWMLEDTITNTFYLDNPNPDWYKIPVTGDWRSREWCYAISAVVGGVDGAKSVGVFVAIGNSGYLNLEYRNACDGPTIIPFPYMANQVSVHFYYTDPSGTTHEFEAIHLYNAYPYAEGDPQHSYNEEWEWKLPVIALDGTVVPWDINGKYSYEMDTPDGGYRHETFAPYGQLDASWYNQVSLYRIPNSAYNVWCPVGDGPGGNYSFWQNVTR